MVPRGGERVQSERFSFLGSCWLSPASSVRAVVAMGWGNGKRGGKGGGGWGGGKGGGNGWRSSHDHVKSLVFKKCRRCEQHTYVGDGCCANRNCAAASVSELSIEIVASFHFTRDGLSANGSSEPPSHSLKA